MTEEEFAKKIKEKYPQYSSFSDKDLTKKVLKKYPTYESQVDKGPGVVKKVLGFGKDIVKDATKTLITRPALRTGQAIGGTISQAIINRMPDSNPNKATYQQNLDRELSKETKVPIMGSVESQKAFGQGGGKQIAGNTLETAGWLYGTGKVANLAMKKAAETSTKKFLGQMAKEGFIGGGLGSAGSQLSNTGKINPLSVARDAAIGGVASPVLGFGLNKLLTRKVGKIADEVSTPKVEEPRNIVEVGDRKFKVDEPTFNQYKQQEQKTLSKIDELTKKTGNPNLDQQKLDYYTKQIRDEQSKLDKYKRDITGNYTATELKTLVNKNRKEFAKQGLPDQRTDEQIIDQITSKRVEYNPDLEVPTQTKVETPTQVTTEGTPTQQTSQGVIKRGDIAQQEEVFKSKFNEKGEDYWRDVASKKIEDPDVSPQIALRQLEMKYDIDGDVEKLMQLKDEAGEITLSEQGRGLAYLNSGEAGYGPITALQQGQNVLDAKLKRMGVDITPDVEDGMKKVLKDINEGKSFNEAIDSFVDFITCK